MFKIFSKKLFSNNNLKEFYGNSLIKTKENIENLKEFKEKWKFTQKHFTFIHAKNDQYFQKTPEQQLKPLLLENQKTDPILIQRLLRCSPVLVKKYHRPNFNKIIEKISRSYKMTGNNIRGVLYACPYVAKSLKYKVHQIYKIMERYTKISRKLYGQIIYNHPYILKIRFRQIDFNLKTLRLLGFSKDQIIQILISNSEPLTLKSRDIFTLPHFKRKLKIKREKWTEILTNNPQLVSINTGRLQMKKIKILRQMNIDIIMQKRMFFEYPQIFLKSIESLKLKIMYLNQKWEMNFKTDPSFPAILMFNYNETIRPRGEAMRNTGKIYPWKEVLYLSDLEFCNKINLSFEKFIEIKNERRENQEVDIEERFYSKWFSYDRYKKF